MTSTERLADDFQAGVQMQGIQHNMKKLQISNKFYGCLHKEYQMNNSGTPCIKKSFSNVRSHQKSCALLLVCFKKFACCNSILSFLRENSKEKLKIDFCKSARQIFPVLHKIVFKSLLVSAIKKQFSL